MLTDSLLFDNKFAYTPMMIFRRMKKPALYLWAFLLSVSLLCAQGVKLHVHSFGQEHDHGQQYHQITNEAVIQHSRLSKIHLSADISHTDHHDEVLLELEANPDGFLKKVSNILTLALLTTLFALLLVRFYQQRSLRYRENIVVFPPRYLFYPPLRAPPL